MMPRMEIRGAVIRFRKRYFTAAGRDVSLWYPDRQLVRARAHYGLERRVDRSVRSEAVYLNDLYRAINKKRAADSRCANREGKRAIIVPQRPNDYYDSLSSIAKTRVCVSLDINVGEIYVNAGEM